MAAREILGRMRNADRIEFCVGTKINDARRFGKSRRGGRCSLRAHPKLRGMARFRAVR